MCTDTEIALAAILGVGEASVQPPGTQLQPFWFVSDVISLDLGVHNTALQSKHQPALPSWPLPWDGYLSGDCGVEVVLQCHSPG